MRISDWSSDVCSSDLITLLRDSNDDGKPELRTTFIKDLDAPYGLALVDGSLYVANQGALLRFPYRDGQTSISAPGAEVAKLPSAANKIGRATDRERVCQYV